MAHTKWLIAGMAWAVLGIGCGDSENERDTNTANTNTANTNTADDAMGITLSEPDVYREQSEACEGATPAVNYTHAYWLDGELCGADDDCSEAADGACMFHKFPTGYGSYCRYPECASDDDCPSDSICVCPGSPEGTSGRHDDPPMPYCSRPGNCRVDADCGPDHRCMAFYNGFTIDVAFYCTSDSDTCRTDMDCNDGFVCKRSEDDTRFTCVEGGDG